jgi:hypothetical protein
MTDEQTELREAVRAESEDGHITCARALAIARRMKVDPLKVGNACNAERIKITRCQLGCFGWK